MTILVPGLPLGGTTPTVYALSSTKTGWAMSKSPAPVDSLVALWGVFPQKNYRPAGHKAWPVVTKASSPDLLS